MHSLELDARLSESIRPSGPRSTDEPVNILLTGATGYLGSFLLHELLATTSADVYCVVRADDESHARGRLRAALSSYGLWEDAFSMRIVPVLGDMTKPRLALSQHAFAELGERSDLIVHAAANVNFLFPYRALRAANVAASVDLLRLACAGRQKRLHFVSTMGIFLSPEHSGRHVREDDALAFLPANSNGYSQSKWVAERLMMAARERGALITVHRPGFVGWQSRTGTMNEKDFVSGMLRASITLGKAPDVAMTLDVAPVDYVARAITWLSMRADSTGKTYHLNNPAPWTWRALIEAFRAEGVRLEWTTYAAWRTELAGRKDPALHRFATMLPEHVREPGSIFAALEAPPTFGFDTIARDLSGSGIVCPKLDGGLVNAFLGNPNAGRQPRIASSTELVSVAGAIPKAG